MQQEVGEPPALDDRRILLGAAAVAIGAAVLVYLPVLERMVVHWTIDPDYSHGFIIAPLALYFAWEKRRELARCKIEGSWWGAPCSLSGWCRCRSVSSVGSSLC